MAARKKLPAKVAARVAELRAAAAREKNGITALQLKLQAVDVILGELVDGESNGEEATPAAP